MKLSSLFPPLPKLPELPSFLPSPSARPTGDGVGWPQANVSSLLGMIAPFAPPTPPGMPWTPQLELGAQSFFDSFDVFLQSNRTSQFGGLGPLGLMQLGPNPSLIASLLSVQDTSGGLPALSTLLDLGRGLLSGLPMPSDLGLPGLTEILRALGLKDAANPNDGKLIGENGTAPMNATAANFDAFPGIRPTGADPNERLDKILYINGADTDAWSNQAYDPNAVPYSAANQAHMVADVSHAEVVTVYNATDNVGFDMIQTLEDQLNIGNNPAVSAAANIIYEKVRRGESLEIVGASQGAAIAARALRIVKERLLADGLSLSQCEDRMSQLKVVTLGPAAHDFPDGPRYMHYVNRADAVTMLQGGPKHPGRGAEVHTFYDNRGHWLENHTLAYAQAFRDHPPPWRR